MVGRIRDLAGATPEGDDMRVKAFGSGMLAMLLGAVVSATAAGDGLIAADGFGNGPLADLDGSTGGVGWAGPWIDVMGDVVTGVVSEGLDYPDLATTPGAALTGLGGSSYPITRYARSFGALPPNTSQIYVSFLMRDDAGQGIWGGLLFGTYPFAMWVGSPPGTYSFGLMMSQGLGDISNATLVQGETNLVVVKISKNTPGSGITYRLYLNPAIGAAEPSFPLAQFALGPVNALPTSLAIDNGGGFTTDEIRVGTTWASVLPADACPYDLNDDGAIDAADLALVLGGWGTGAPDLTGDGIVNAADIAQLLGAWGGCP